MIHLGLAESAIINSGLRYRTVLQLAASICSITDLDGCQGGGVD
jgi:hypothetical protein